MMSICQVETFLDRRRGGNNVEFDAQKTKDRIVDWIRAFFDANGKDCKAVVAI